MSPAENAVKETKEEAGLDVAGEVGHRRAEPRFSHLPPYAYGVVKIFYLCDEARRRICRNSETVRDRLL